MKTESVRIPSELLAQVRKLAQEQRRTIAAQITVLLEAALKQAQEAVK